MWLDSVLNLIVPLFCGAEYCRDTLHLLEEIHALNSSPSFSTSELSLLTIDVVDMYNSIPHADGIAACGAALEAFSSYSSTQISLILELISHILTSNVFSFNGSFYRQVVGTAMGSPFAPAYANLFMALFWRERVTPYLPVSPIWHKRYIDDMLSLFPSSLEHESFLLFLNSRHPSVKFTVSPPSSSVPFLDVTVHFFDSLIHTDLYSKPTDSHLYLSPSSSHPPHIFRSIVYSGALRLLRICSRETYLFHRLFEFHNHLLSSGYHSKFILSAFGDVLKQDRLSLLKPKARSTKSDRTLFVTTFHPQMPDIRQLHSENANILQKSTKMSKLLPSPPLTALRRTPNLGNILIKTKPRTTPCSTDKPGCHPCSRSNCAICRDHLIALDSITSSVTKQKFPIKQHIHCNSTNLIYIITCSLCNKQYTGQTSTTLRQRLNNHKSAIRRPNTTESVASHFQQTDHSIKNLRVQGVELVPVDPDKATNARHLSEAESRWMWAVKSHRINGGLNVDEPHFSNLTLSN